MQDPARFINRNFARLRNPEPQQDIIEIASADSTTGGEGRYGRIRSKVRQLYPTLTEAGLHIYTIEWIGQINRLKETEIRIGEVEELIQMRIFDPAVTAQMKKDRAQLKCLRDKIKVLIAEYEHQPGALKRGAQGSEAEAKII